MMQKPGYEGSVEDKMYSKSGTNTKSMHKNVKSKPLHREPEFIANHDTVSDSGVSSQQQNVEVVQKSNFMRLYELKAQVPNKLILSSSSIKDKTREKGVTIRPALDYETKVSSWLTHEYLNMSSAPSPSPPPSTPPSPSPSLSHPPSLCPPPPPADPHAQTSSQIDKVPIRHSRRKRIKPIEYWNNETVIYEDDGTFMGVENATTFIEFTGYKDKTKNPTEVREVDKENPHTLKTINQFRSPLKNKTNVKSKNVNTIDRTKDKKVAKSKSETSKDKRRIIKSSEKSSNKRKFDKEETEISKADSALVSKISNDIKTNPKKKKAKLETIPLPSSNLDIGVRRGSRTRIKPVAFWDNEFVQYDDDGNFLGVEHVGVSAEEIKEDKNKTRHKSSDEKISLTSSVTLSSGGKSSDSGSWKKNKAKKPKKLNITDLATKIVRRSKGGRKKNLYGGLSEYPFNQLNKERSFTLGRILEITDKDGTIRKLSPMKEAEKIINQAEFPSKENTIKKQVNSNINEKTLAEDIVDIGSVNEVGLQPDGQEKASKEAALEAQSSPPTEGHHSGVFRRSRRSRITPVEYWNSQYVRYDNNGTLSGVEDWIEKTRLKTPLKEPSNENAKEAATNDVRRRRLFVPTVSSTTNSRASNADVEAATTTLSVKIRPIRKQNRDQTSNRVLNLIDEGISELPLTPIAEESSKIIDGTKSGALLSDTPHKSKGTNKVQKKSPMTWLRKEMFEYVQNLNDNGENNCNSEVSRVEVGESNSSEDDLITDFEAPIENSDGVAEELRFNQTTKQIQPSKDHLGKILLTSPRPTPTPYQVMQRELEQFQLNASMKSPQTGDGNFVKTTISFVPQKVNHLPFNAPWATLASKKRISNFEEKSKNMPKESYRKSGNSSENCTENTLYQNLYEEYSLQVEKENHRHKDSNMMNKSAHTDRYEENSPILKTRQKVFNEQKLRSAQIRLQKEASSDVSVSPSSKSSAQQNTDVCIPPGIDANVPIYTDASVPPHENNDASVHILNKTLPPPVDNDVTESLEAYVQSMKNCPDRTSHSKSYKVTQDTPEYSGGETLDTTTGYEEKENHEFYPIKDAITGLEICHMAKSVADSESGIYTAFISIQSGRGIKTWPVTEDSAVFVIEGIGTLCQKFGKKTKVTPLEPNDVVNLAKGEMVSLSYNVRKSMGRPLLVMLIVGGTSIEWPELAEGLEQEG